MNQRGCREEILQDAFIYSCTLIMRLYLRVGASRQHILTCFSFISQPCLHLSLVQLALASFFRTSAHTPPPPPSPPPLKSRLGGGGERDTSGWPRPLTKPTTSHCLGAFYLLSFFFGLSDRAVFCCPSFDSATRPNMARDRASIWARLIFQLRPSVWGFKSFSQKS